MKRMLIAGAAVAAVVVVGVVLAATLGGGGGSSSSGSTATPPAPRGDAVVSVSQIDDVGSVLVDREGQALYAADEEANGMVLCTAECTSFWAPLTVTGGVPSSDGLPGELGLVTRPDGAGQVTYDGRLLYSFSLDDAGEVTGDGFADAFGGQQLTWHVVHSDGSPGASDAGAGGISGLPGY
jgi:predicted lipoprotein with Yx(FWY)xxD motif